MKVACILTVMNPENLSNEGTSLGNFSESQKKNKWKGIFKEIVIFAVIAFGIILPFRAYIAEPYLVDGRSMDPTFATGDYLIVDKISDGARNPERHAVVVFKYPKDTTKSFIKRIIGLPGETVILDGTITRIKNSEYPNGFTLDESYVTHTSQASLEITLASGEYFVMGDNRAESFDSRSWGPLQRKYMIGRPIVRLFPVNQIEITPGKI